MRAAMRALGFCNVLTSFCSLYYFVWGIQIHVGRWPGNPNQQQWNVFYAITALSTALVFYLAYLGVRLIRLETAALWQVATVFAVEIAVVLTDFVLTWIATPVSIGKDALWFWGIAIFALDPQVFYGYAPLGLCAALWMAVAAKRPAEQESTPFE
ncbi:MAG TPA: hypothetical protein VGI45_33645 [Terracidiphilus sp.]|jgi:hypothetical protein